MISMGKHHDISSPSSIASSTHRPRSRIPLAVTRLPKNDVTLDTEHDHKYDSNITAKSGVKHEAPTHDDIDDLPAATVKAEDDSAINSDEVSKVANLISYRISLSISCFSPYTLFLHC